MCSRAIGQDRAEGHWNGKPPAQGRGRLAFETGLPALQDIRAILLGGMGRLFCA
jgi:hypothetical protein